MFSQTYYAVRSQNTGQYLVAHPDQDSNAGFLLLFSSDYDAYSYVNTHTQGPAPAFAVEGLPTTALKATLNRWQLSGVGVVSDPLIPHIEFYRTETRFPFM